MQNYMFLGLKSPYKAIFSLHFAQIALAAFAILAGLVASGSVFLNDLYFSGQSAHYINPYLCLIAFFLAFAPGAWGLAVVIFLLPLSAGLGTQLNAYFGAQFLILPNAGLDLTAGFFLGSALIEISKAPLFLGKNRARDLMAAIKDLVPWPIALVIAMITISTAIAISRNVYQSAAATSFKGLLFNLVHFRPIGWHDDYMPISDWIAYALAVAMIILVIGKLKNQENKNQIIFRPIMAGLIIAALMGVSQAITGIGLPENLLSFRKDQLGYAVIGFQPDLHAFAGHMLLGAVGLWGYFYSGVTKLEKKFILLTVALCWAGLVLSKSRALLLIALAAMFVWLVWYLWKNKRRVFLPAIGVLATILTIIVVFIFNFSNDLSGIPVLSWLGELANEFKSRDLTSWSLFSGIFGSRFEIWEAAIRMWWEFPLMGIGQGNFYRLSDIASFSKSHFLILNGGENAHNYFLQTLAETGVVGVIVFSMALFLPFFMTNKKKILLPSMVAIVSLFLGNIFSHSFLVRENIVICAVFLGLLWTSSKVSMDDIRLRGIACNKYANLIKSFLLASLASILIGSLLFEVRLAYQTPPFQWGTLCFVDRPIMEDGWSSGIYEMTWDKGLNHVELDLVFAPHGKRDLISNVNVLVLGLDKTIPLDLGLTKITENKIHLSAKLLNDRLIENKNTRIRIVLSECFTPRNLGVSLDGRRLGSQVSIISF